jgi:hypothetical protein
MGPLKDHLASVHGDVAVIGNYTTEPDVATLAGDLQVLRDAVGALTGVLEGVLEMVTASPTVEVDTDALGNALERAVDGLSQDVKGAIETGLGGIELAVKAMDR